MCNKFFFPPFLFIFIVCDYFVGWRVFLVAILFINFKLHKNVHERDRTLSLTIILYRRMYVDIIWRNSKVMRLLSLLIICWHG